MAGPSGALAATFKITRILQAISLIAIIGMAANFISEMVSAKENPPEVLIATLSVTCIGVLYCFLTYVLFVDNILPFLINTALDGLLTIALVVIAVVVGKPLSFLNCKVIGDITGGSAYAFAAELESELDKDGGKIEFSHWIGATKTICYEMKAIWGLSIALCILFAFSAICSVCLWRQGKKAPAKDVEG